MSAVGTTLFIAQGVMRAKPEMKPWEYVDKTEKSSVGAALQREDLSYVLLVPPLWGSINMFQ